MNTDIYVRFAKRFHKKGVLNIIFSLSSFKDLFLDNYYHLSNPKIQKQSIDNKFVYHHNLSESATPFILNQSDRSIINRIRELTHKYNQNNVTRTAAYLSFFIEHPEIHWAFLAHMVSRNGGYYMTDLKSSLLAKWLSSEEQHRYFLFLERSNAYIFQDAYPQLCLYAYSKKQGKPLFQLLQAFHISTFMKPQWDIFFQQRDSKQLTVSLIINEQQMLEERVIKGIYESKSLLSELPFQLQEYLGFTNIYFPYRVSKPYVYRLSGKIINHFADVQERIMIGKYLYQILFFSKYFPVTLQYAKRQAHTGSRSDYWPKLYTTDSKAQSKFLSPRLLDSWDIEFVTFSHKNDWYHSDMIFNNDVFELPEVRHYDITSHAIKNYVLLKTLTVIQK